MTDVLGGRLKIGVVTPSVNTVTQPEYDDMRPAGVTNHIARIHVPNIETTGDGALLRSVSDLDHGVDDAVERVLSCEPGVLVLGVSIEAVYGDPGAGGAIEARVQSKFGADLRLVHAGAAIPAALAAMGIDGGPIALLTPYGSEGEPHLTSFVKSCGYGVHAFAHLMSPSLVQIAHNGPDVIRPKLDQLFETQPQAIVQFGANLPMMRVAAEAEADYGIPVIAVNTALYWHTLRTCGIADQQHGFGRLMAEK